MNSGTKIAYFDCYSGISGDMALGGLLDCGLELSMLQDFLSGLKLDGYHLSRKQVKLYGLTGTKLTVNTTGPEPPSRHLADIEKLIEQSSLPAPVREKSLRVFNHLARAEAAVHGVSVQRVHFHEVGAVDAIVDIVGTVSALHLLGIEQLFCSPLPLSSGMTDSSHGRIPLPAPATLELLRHRRAPLYGCPVEVELVTPTGAALITALADGFGPPPPFKLEQVGYGAGEFDPGYPNFLRVLMGRRPVKGGALEQQIKQVEANIDDLNPEIYGYLMEQLFRAGALDVYFSPIQMKKNRPAVKLTVLTLPTALQGVIQIIFDETSTLGLRVTAATKIMRPRETITVNTRWGPVKIKLTTARPGHLESVHFAPEYEDCREIALRAGVPLKEVYREVELLYQQRHRR
ncbi:MAG: nickel pincer cofactor biosynthesis protein LarC [Firmicutes bacterium]|nr:nickel pincer cofactor biosynthesis protein LarC [Bacillota bacterium]